eukprot:1191253-Prorocentrum_minimum.AAC.7
MPSVAKVAGYHLEVPQGGNLQCDPPPLPPPPAVPCWCAAGAEATRDSGKSSVKAGPEPISERNEGPSPGDNFFNREFPDRDYLPDNLLVGVGP